MRKIQILQGDYVVIKSSSICDMLTHGKVLYFDRVIMHYKTTKIFDIPLPLPKKNIPIPY